MECEHKNAICMHENMPPYCPDCKQSFESYWHVKNDIPRKANNRGKLIIYGILDDKQRKSEKP